MPVHNKFLWVEGRSVSGDYYDVQLSLFGKAQLYYNTGAAYSFLNRSIQSKRYLEKAKRSGYVSDAIQRHRVIFSIPTHLKPNRWYKNIFITDSVLDGKLVRGMHFENPETVPESVYFLRRPDFIVKNSNISWRMLDRSCSFWGKITWIFGISY